MARTPQPKDIELAQDVDFQRRSWKVQRIGWALMALFVLAGLLGILGSGPLSNARAGEEGAPLWLEYQRFGRLQAPMWLKVHLGSQEGANGMARIWLDRVYLDDVSIEAISPEPERVETAGERVVYTFSIATPDQPSAITFQLKPQQIGRLSGRVGLAQSAQSYWHFIYP